MSNQTDRVTQLYSDLSETKLKQFNAYVNADKDTDSALLTYANKRENFTLLFSNNNSIGAVPTLTGAHLFVIEHLLVGNSSAIERVYDMQGKAIAWRFKQWWNQTWTEWENS